MDPKIFTNLESNINNYDNNGPFSIGFKMFLFGFTLVFLIFFYSYLGLNDESSTRSRARNARGVLLSIGIIVAILGLITSIVSVWMNID
jgi:hypothetical protein